jgi:PAS domain S-box-containing protein
VNHAAVRKYGYTREEFLKMTLKDIPPSQDIKRCVDHMTGRRSVLQHFGEWRHKLKDGRIIDVKITSQTMTYQGHKAAFMIVHDIAEGKEKGYFLPVFNDITERKNAEEALRESEERFRMVFDHAFDGISIYREDPDPSKRTLIECNERYAAMAGRSREELVQLGSTLGLQITLDDTANTNRLESLTKGTAYCGSYSWIRPDGKENINEYVGMPITWRGRSYTIGIDRDVTERKEAERELRLMAQTVASAQDCICITDLEGRLLFVNDALRLTYGYTAEDLLGKEVSILTSPHAPAAVSDQIHPLTLAGGWHGELLNRRKDGNDLPVELWTSLVRDEEGIPVAMVGVMRDITDRKIAEQNLKESEEQFRLITENVADMIAVLDLDGRRIYNSPSYNSVLGDPESLKGTDGFREIHPDDNERIKEVFRETARTGVGQRLEYRLIGIDGSTRNIESKGSVIRDRDGKISRVVVVSRDVT